mgnify:CR=1 FL=1|jgi:predicted nucleic acid-binding protein
MELHPTFGARSLEILEQVDRGFIKGYISSLVLMEVCWYMEASGKIDEMRGSVEIVKDSRLEIIELQQSDITGAVEVKPNHREIDLNDLINYHVMRRLGITNIYTNDSHFKRLTDIKTHFKDN